MSLGNGSSKSAKDIDKVRPSFDWDDANRDHIAKHDIQPKEAEEGVANGFQIDQQYRNGEVRSVHLGATNAGRVLTVVLTERTHKYRVVTAHPADRKARNFHAELISKAEKDADS